jgi:hypothetical protein
MSASSGGNSTRQTQQGGGGQGSSKSGGGSAPSTNRGQVYVNETAAMSKEAAAYEAGAPNPGRANGQVPALKYDNPFGGRNLVKFDGIEGKTLIDRKLSFYSNDKGKLALQRQSEALKQNPGYSGRIEVPTATEQRRIQKYMNELNITNIDVKVVPK